MPLNAALPGYYHIHSVGDVDDIDAEIEAAARAFAYALTGKLDTRGLMLTHSMPIAGLPYSCRIFTDHQFEGGTPYPSPLSLESAARDLLLSFVQEARFLPEPKYEKSRAIRLCHGMDIHGTFIATRPAIVICASYFRAKAR